VISNIQAVLFDYGMVLSGPPDASAWARMRSITALDEDVFHREYWAHRHPYDRGDLSGSLYWQKVATGAGLATLSPEQLSALIQADIDLWTEPNQPMIDWARQLQQAGIRTGILSNLGDEMNIGIVEKFPWLEDFHHRTWSHTLNLAKPEAAIYRHAAEGLGTAPEHILFLDDRLDNIEAAHAAGMHAIQYLNHADFLAEMKREGLGALLHHAPPISPLPDPS
jgi:putative hydrolase of the HAD superfamily